MSTVQGGPSPADREALAALVAAVLGARAAPATERFDAELRRAQDEGLLDAGTARTLRFWQRASVAEVGEYAAAALPAVLVTTADADDDAHAAAELAAGSWEQARPLLPGAAGRRLLVAGITVAPDAQAGP
jgi:hypothetical protein